MNHKKPEPRSLLVLMAALAPLAARAADSGPQLPPSAVDNYRVETQYGSSTAVLEPAFARDGKVELELGGAWAPMSTLEHFYSANGSLTYHIDRRNAIEPVWFGYAWGTPGSFVQSQIASKPHTGSNSVLGVEIPQQLYSFSYLFSPFYAKMHITEQSVTHFDVYFGAGAGFVRGRSSFLDGSQGDAVIRPAGSLAAGLRFLWPSRWSARLEVRDFISSSENFGAVGLGNTLQVAASVGVFFGAFPDRSEN